MTGLEQGESLFARGYPEEAEACFQTLLAQDAGNCGALNNLGVIAFSRHEHQKARDLFLMVLDADPYHLEAAGNLCQVLKLTGRLPDAAALLKRLVQRYPSNRTMAALLDECLELAAYQDFIGSILSRHFQRPAHTFDPANWLKQFESVPCMLCGGRGELLLNDGGGALRACRRCGLVYASPRLGKEGLLRCYVNYLPSAIANRQNDNSTYAEDLRKIEQELVEIETWMPPGTILDVGASAGSFLDGARSRGWQVAGTELSDHGIAAAAKLFGIGLMQGEIPDLKLEDESFDAVTLRNTIEHMRDPVGEMRILHRSLKSGGVIFVHTPAHAKDMDCLLKYHMLPQHLYNFTTQTLEKLLTHTGFEVLSRLAVCARPEDPPIDSIKIWARKP